MDAARVATLRVGTSTYLFTEDDAITMLDEFRRAFGWAAVAFTRRDVEDAHGEEITDEEWSEVQATYEWRRAMVERMTEAGFAAMDGAVEVLMAGVDDMAEDFLLNHDARNP